MDLSGNSRDIARWIWKNLVPKSGQADTVQGELLRAVEKLRWEAHNNGNGNWDDRFEMLIDFLRSTLFSEHRLPEPVRETLNDDLATLLSVEQPYMEDDLFDRMEDAVISFCRLNPVLIRRHPDPKQYR